MTGRIIWHDELKWVRDYRFPIVLQCRDYASEMHLWMHDYCDYIDKCNSLNEEEKSEIKQFALNLLRCHNEYMDCQFAEAYLHFNQTMTLVENRLIAAGWESTGFYYRIRKGDKLRNNLEMLHVPLSHRKQVSTGRFSAPGMPCCYLSNSKEICWYECGMPKNFQIAKYQLNRNLAKEKRLLRLDINPLQFIDNILMNNSRNDDYMKEMSERIFFMLPLVASCSVIAEKRAGTFVEEYIIPQMLMAWLRGSKSFIGIRYRSSISNDLARNNSGYNVAIPVRDDDNKGYSAELCALFAVSEDQQAESVNILDAMYTIRQDKIRMLQKFLEDVNYELQHFKTGNPQLDKDTGCLYCDYCTICKTCLALLDEYKEGREESNYGVVLALSKLSRWGDLLKEHVENGKLQYDAMANKYIDRFNKEILPFMFEINSLFRIGTLWGN